MLFNIVMGIGKNIKTITKNKGMTLVELSKKSGVSLNTIHMLTRDDPTSATLRTIDKLAAALDIDSNMLRMDPEEYKAYEEQVRMRIKLQGILLDREFLRVPLPEGVHLVEDYEDALTQVVYPEGAIDVTYEEMDKIKENIERYAAFTLESFKQDHKDRIKENKKDDSTT